MRRRRPSGVPIKLDAAVAEVTADYLAFLRNARTDEPEDAKAFAARHAAAKSALSHIEQIIKLASGNEEEVAGRQLDTDSLLHQAREQIIHDNETQEDSEGDGEAG